MTFDQVMLIFDYWRQHPPTRDLIAAFVGYKSPPNESSDDKSRAPTIAEIKAFYPDGYIRG